MKIEPGQVAVVTGGASGIGFGLAERLADRGVHVVIADIREDAAVAAAATLSDRGHQVLSIRTDVADPDDVAALAAATLERFGRVDLVCNNAGVVCETVPSWQQRLETWQWLVNVKLMGVVHGVRAFVPHLIEQGTGHVLNTASLGGLIAMPTLSPYCATMHAVVGLTETLNMELRSVAPTLGATVLCPGVVDTSLGESSSALVPPGAVTIAMDSGSQMPGPALQPGEVADATLAAVEADRVHAIIGAGTAPATRYRVDALLADLPPAD